MTSVVIAAHNEEAVIGRCLDALAAQIGVEHLDVTVAPNACTDRTAEIARGRGVRVVETERPGKAGALNLAEQQAVGFPRIYLDADIVLPPHAVAALEAAVAPGTGFVAAVPRRHLDVSGRPVLVRSYTAISARLPVFRNALFGRGVITLSEQGRARFETFPEMVADDLFLDSCFTEAEKAIADSVEVTVEAPRRTKDLVNRLIRVRRGNTQMRLAGASGTVSVAVRKSAPLAWLTEVVRPDPRLAPAGVVYAAITLYAALRAKASAGAGLRWERDESTRLAPVESGERTGGPS